MGFAQAYYTSCEHGLSGFSGFQFNAVTPGLAPQVLREVEALTCYEAPRSVGYRPGAAEIAACPVNLVYRCEPTPILAKVVFVGLDSSQRLGNYFAHALIGTRDDSDHILPIEFWGSTIWQHDPIGASELPNLEELPAPEANGPLTRAGVAAFLAGRHRSEQLATLVTAAEAAVLRGGRSIVIIEPENTAAATWIAAISFLLPPDVARRMSFATYQHRPEYCDLHVIATLPESDFDGSDPASQGYLIFDALSGRISELPAEPAAALLVRAGPTRAGELWERAAQLVDPSGPTTLAQGHPALVLAALQTGSRVSVADLDVLINSLDSKPGGGAP